MLQLGALLSEKIQKTVQIDEKTLLYLCEQVVEEEYGKKGLSMVKVEACKKNTLYLFVTNSQWASVVWLYRGDIIRKINKKCGKTVINGIKVKS